MICLATPHPSSYDLNTSAEVDEYSHTEAELSGISDIPTPLHAGWRCRGKRLGNLKILLGFAAEIMHVKVLSASLNFLLTFMQLSRSSHRPRNPGPLHKPTLNTLNCAEHCEDSKH